MPMDKPETWSPPPHTIAAMSQIGLRRSQRNVKRALILQPYEHGKGPCLIENLPPEILREIFTYRFDQWLIPLPLFLVNHRWNQVASGLSLLRSVIHMCRPENYNFISTEHDIPVFCTSAAQFANALARLGDGKFTLSISWIPRDISLEKFPLQHRCRCLDLALDASGSDSPLKLPPMCALEELSVGEYIESVNFDTVYELLEQLEVSATSLRSLRIDGRFPMPLILIERKQLLERLTSFEVATDLSFTNYHMDSLLDGLSNVKTVVWEPETPQAALLSTFPKSLTRLSLLHASFIQMQELNNLVHLTIGYSVGSDEWVVDPEVQLHFPALETLSLVGSWADLQRLRAPLLRHLSLQYPRETNREIRAIIKRVTIEPKVLTISNQISDYNLKSLLRGVWAGIEELHLLGCEHRELPGDALIRELSGTTTSGVICPQLWCLTFRVRRSEEEDPESFRQSVERLQGVRDSRKERKIEGLVSVKCGWDEDGVVEAGAGILAVSGMWYDVL